MLPANSSRRRFQYSLRSLLVFMLLANVFMAWFGALAGRQGAASGGRRDPGAGRGNYLRLRGRLPFALHNVPTGRGAARAAGTGLGAQAARGGFLRGRCTRLAPAPEAVVFGRLKVAVHGPDHQRVDGAYREAASADYVGPQAF